jgi:hypothetical protein
VKLRKAETFVSKDWYVVESDDGNGIGDADVEGYPEHMKGIATAIRERGEAYYKRCAVRVDGNYAYLWSPRNSRRHTRVSLAEADALADIIEREVVP